MIEITGCPRHGGAVPRTFLAAQTMTGLHAFNAERADEGQPTITLQEYIASGLFSATAEWARFCRWRPTSR
jgi:hypothetical protein